MRIIGGDISLDMTQGHGLILEDSASVCWKLTVNTSGGLVTQKVPCPN
jgi:hypothetical protein